MAQATPFRNPSGVTVWRVQFRIGPKSFQETFRLFDKAGEVDEAASKKAAEKFAASVNRVGGKAAREQLESRKNRVTHAPTLREWADKYLDPASGILTRPRQQTRNDYRAILERSILPRLGDLQIDEITPDDVGAWMLWIQAQPSGRRGSTGLVAPKTVKNYHHLLSNLFKAAVKRHLIPENPAEGLRVADDRATEEAVFLSASEFRRLHQAVRDDHKGLVFFLAGTGCRWGEATALTWADVNTETNPATIRINKAFKRGGDIGAPKTKAGRRTIGVPHSVIEAMGERGEPGDLVFKSPQGGKVWYGGFSSRIWKPAVKAAGLTDRHPTPHDLRHTHASWLISDGKPLPYIQRRLGHEKITTTVDTYGHLVPDVQTEMADSIGAFLALDA